MSTLEIIGAPGALAFLMSAPIRLTPFAPNPERVMLHPCAFSSPAIRA